MKFLKEYMNAFVSDEEGSEFLQMAIVVVLVVGLIAVLVVLFSNIGDKIQESADQVGSMSVGTGSQTNSLQNTATTQTQN